MHVAGWADGINSILAAPPLHLPLETHPKANESGKQEACTHGFSVWARRTETGGQALFIYLIIYLRCLDSLKDVPISSLST